MGGGCRKEGVVGESINVEFLHGIRDFTKAAEARSEKHLEGTNMKFKI